MTRITHPTTAYYFNSHTSISNQPHPPDPQAGKRLDTLLNAPDTSATAPLARQQPPEASPFHPYLPQASLTPTDPHPVASLERQGRQAALALLAEARLTKASLRVVLTEHADTPQALAGFFAALGPQNTFEALVCLDHHERDRINPSGYAPLPERGRGRLWEMNLVEALHRDQHRRQREMLADALSKATKAGLSEDFLQDLAAAASATPRAANLLSQILIRCDDAALLPLKATLFNTLMTSQKALKAVRDNDPQKQVSLTDQRGWVRAATLLLGNEVSDQWLARLQDKVGSTGLSQFMTTAVEETVDMKLEGSSYGDKDYQRGLAGLLRGLAQLEGQAYTALKAHVFSAACDAMGERHTRAALTEGLKAVFVSDPKGIAMEIANNSEDNIQSNLAFSFFFREAIFKNPNPNSKFIEAISLTLKELYQDSKNISLHEIENDNTAYALGQIFGNLRAAFDDAKADNKADQEAVRNIVNVLTGFATIFPQISTQLSAAKDGIVVPFFSTLLNFNNRQQAQNLDLIDETFNKLIGAMTAGFNGYKEETGRLIRSSFDNARNITHNDTVNWFKKNED